MSGLEKQLITLGLDYVDLYLVHWPVVESLEDGSGFVKLPLHKVWEGMEACFKKGLAKNIGVSNYTVALLVDMMAYAEVRPAVNQIELHPYL